MLGWAELANIWTGTANGPAARSTAFAAGCDGDRRGPRTLALARALSRRSRRRGGRGARSRCSRRSSDRGRRGRGVRGAHARLDRTVAPQLDCTAAARHRARSLVAARRRGRNRSRTAAGAEGSERPCAGRTRSAVPRDQAGLDRPARHGFEFARWDSRPRTRAEAGEAPAEATDTSPRLGASCEGRRPIPHRSQARPGRSGSTWSRRSCWSCSSSPRCSRRACSPRDSHGGGCGAGWRPARLPTRSLVLGHGRECGWKRAGCRWP